MALEVLLSFQMESKIFYYVLSIQKFKRILPMAEMVTSEHDTCSMENFLKYYKYFIKSQTTRWPVFKIIVTDWCWAFINALSAEWNDMSFLEYLDLCYDCITKKKYFDTNKIVLHFCLNHNQHRIKRNVKDNFPELMAFKDIILEITAVFTRCRTLDQLKSAYKHFVNIFLEKDGEKVESYLNKINDIRKKINIMMGKEEEEIEEIGKDGEGEEEEEDGEKYEVYENFTDSKAVYASSPFWTLFSSISREIEVSLSKDNDFEVTNKMYSPKFVDFFTKNYMAYAPLWTGLILNFVKPKIDTLNNAPAEGLFNNVKNGVMDRKKAKSIGKFIETIRNYKECFNERSAYKC